MKKFFAAALALTMTAAMFTACGDDNSSSSKAADSSAASSAADSSSAAESSSVEESSAADTSSEADASSTEGDASSTDGGEEGDQPVDISEAKNSLKNYDNALVTFTADTDVTKLIGDMQESFSSIKQDAQYVKDGKNAKGKDYTVDDFNKTWEAKGKYHNIDASYESEYVQKVLADDTADLEYISGDESRCKYSIEEVAGVPMLKVEVLDKYPDGINYEIPKPRIKLNEIFKGHEDLLPTVNTVKIDMIQRAVGDFTADDGTTAHVPGNFLGTIAIQALKEDNKTYKTWDQQDFAADEWTSEWVYCEGVSKELLVWNTQVLSAVDGDQYVTIMRWGQPNDACFYIADIAFYDVDGNPIKF